MQSDTQTELVPIDLGEGVVAKVEVIATGREEVGIGSLSFNSVTRTIAQLSRLYADAIQKVRPDKATIKYGLAIGIDQGSLMAALVRGTGNANVEITLEWENPAPGKLPNQSDDQKETN
ncbi:MAG: CU044_2847 family protein [Cyanobacteria bacterium P01_D01_bin.56]